MQTRISLPLSYRRRLVYLQPLPVQEARRVIIPPQQRDATHLKSTRKIMKCRGNEPVLTLDVFEFLFQGSLPFTSVRSMETSRTRCLPDPEGPRAVYFRAQLDVPVIP